MTRIVVLDVETTGKDRSRDQIIEIALQLGLGDDAKRCGWRVKPTIPIGPEAAKVHGITDADLVDELPFRLVGEMVVALLGETDVIVGYNVAFDLDMLQAELARAGMAPIDLGAKRIVDVLRLWQHHEPRTLEAAHARFVGTPMTDAHRAGADVAATGRTLRHMVAHWDDDATIYTAPENWNWSALAEIADPFANRASWIGPTNHVQWNADGHAVFGFGKHQGRRLDQVDPGFLAWVTAKDFPPHVKEICAMARLMDAPRFERWLVERYPRRATSTEAA